jgi:hypothetical protein
MDIPALRECISVDASHLCYPPFSNGINFCEIDPNVQYIMTKQESKSIFRVRSGSVDSRTRGKVDVENQRSRSTNILLLYYAILDKLSMMMNIKVVRARKNGSSHTVQRYLVSSHFN